MERITEEMKVWLFDLAHGNLSDEAILKGFLKHYVMHDMGLSDVKREIAFRTTYGAEGAKTAMDSLNRVMIDFIDKIGGNG